MPEGFANLASIEIKIDGSPIDKDESDLEEAVVETVFNLPAMATIRLQDPQLRFVSDSRFSVGKPIQIEMTPPANFGTKAGVVFTGEIVALEPTFTALGAHTFEIRAYDKAHRLFLNRRTQTYEQMRDDQIVRKIAGYLNLPVEVDTAEPTYEYVLQYNQTDMEFLSERARRIGYLLYVQEGTLYFKKPTTRTPGPTLVLGEMLRSFRPRLSAAQQPATYQTRGWDPIKKEVISGEYSTSQYVWVKNGYDKPAGKMASSAFSINGKSYSVEASLVDTKHATAMATADGQAREGDFVEGDGVASLAPKIQAGVELELSGLGERFSGKYFVTSATHYYRPRVQETHFSVTGRNPYTITDLIRPDKSQGSGRGRIDGVVVGIVTQVKDPEDLLRVRVTFPWMPPDSQGQQIESAWARLASINAGGDRGFAYLPEVNDEVLVAFEHGDVNRPYIVGMLWNRKDKPPEANSQLFSEGKVQRRVLYSRTGHIIILDDSTSSPHVLVQDSKGNQLFIDTKKDSITVKATQDITLDAGGNITLKAGRNIALEATADITGKGVKMDFQATGQYNVKAAIAAIKADGAASMEGATLDLKGNATANLQASGMVAVKGGMITLN